MNRHLGRLLVTKYGEFSLAARAISLAMGRKMGGAKHERTNNGAFS